MNCLKNMKMYVSYLDQCYQHVFANTIINSWGYLYYDLKGNCLQIISDKILMDDFFDNELFDVQILTDLTINQNYFHSSDVVNDSFISHQIKEILIGHGHSYFFDIVNKSPDFTEIYTFSTNYDPAYSNNYVLNNLDILKIISLDLASRCRRLLTKENTLILPKNLVIQMNELYESNKTIQSSNLKDNILKSKESIPALQKMISDNVFDFNKLPFSFLGSKDITHREKEIIYLYYQDFNAHRIAEILDLSKRTVDKNFENIKKKLACESIGQIIPALLRYDHSVKEFINKK